MEPPDRKKRVLVTLVSVVVMLAFMGNFFWGFFKDFKPALSGRNPGDNVVLLAFGGFFLVLILAAVISVVQGVRKFSKPDAAVPPREPQPWLKREDWAAGRIKSTGTVPVRIMVIFTLAFGGFGGVMAFFLLSQELSKHNYAALFILLFPLVGVAFLLAFARARLAQRRFGDCFFELAQIPAPLGGTLEGQILVGTRLQLEHGLHLKLSCLRRVTSGTGSDDHTSESILWQNEKVFRPEANLPEPEPGRTGIPIFFKLPANQPECFARGNEAVIWRLEAKAKMSGPNFSAVFEVPVFRVAGAAVAETETDAADPTALLQESVEDLRREEGSQIVISDSPAGREFYFPAARNPGTAVMLTLFLVIWSGAIWLMIVKRAPLLFPVVFGLFAIFILWGCLALWFKSSRVTVNRSGVNLLTRWLIFSRTRWFDVGEIARFETKVGMTSGSQTFQDIKLITRAGGDNFTARKAHYEQTGQRPPVSFSLGNPTIASGIPSPPEANWLVQEMTKALGRKP
jgi:hypothetical protein